MLLEFHFSLVMEPQDGRGKLSGVGGHLTSVNGDTHPPRGQEAVEGSSAGSEQEISLSPRWAATVGPGRGESASNSPSHSGGSLFQSRSPRTLPEAWTDSPRFASLSPTTPCDSSCPSSPSSADSPTTHHPDQRKPRIITTITVARGRRTPPSPPHLSPNSPGALLSRRLHTHTHTKGGTRSWTPAPRPTRLFHHVVDDSEEVEITPAPPPPGHSKPPLQPQKGASRGAATPGASFPGFVDSPQQCAPSPFSRTLSQGTGNGFHGVVHPQDAGDVSSSPPPVPPKPDRLVRLLALARQRIGEEQDT